MLKCDSGFSFFFAEVGGTDVVSLVDNQIPAAIKALGRSEEGEADQQAEEGEDGGVHDADKLLDRAPADFLVPAPHPEADLHGKEQGEGDAKEDGKRQKRRSVGIEEGEGEHAPMRLR